MSKKINLYNELAAYLSPDDPAAGAQQIDTAILAQQRARCEPRNRTQAIFWFGTVLYCLGLTNIAASVGCSLDTELRTTPLASLAGIMALWVAVIIVVVAISLITISRMSYLVDEGYVPRPPRPIYEWLVAHGKSDLRYWHEIYWPHGKVRAHRRELLGFVLWRKTPRSAEEYHRMRLPASARTDPHWVYLNSEEGRADRTAYLIGFEHRMHDWHGLCVKGTLVVMVALFVLIWLPIYPPTVGGHLLRAGVMLVFVAMSVFLAFGLPTVSMRWLPAVIQRYWFRDLPPEAAQFRDHMIALN